MFAPRFSFLPPSTGDKLLAAARSAKLELQRWPTGPDGKPDVEISYELSGSLPVDGSTIDVVRELLREFKRPLPVCDDRGQEGGAV